MGEEIEVRVATVKSSGLRDRDTKRDADAVSQADPDEPRNRDSKPAKKRPRRREAEDEGPPGLKPHQDSTRHQSPGPNPRSGKKLVKHRRSEQTGKRIDPGSRTFLTTAFVPTDPPEGSPTKTRGHRPPMNPTPSTGPSSKTSPSHQIWHHPRQTSQIYRE
ncbi:hypothetical protein Bca4012_001032 [Brassica carinata]